MARKKDFLKYLKLKEPLPGTYLIPISWGETEAYKFGGRKPTFKCCFEKCNTLVSFARRNSKDCGNHKKRLGQIQILTSYKNWSKIGKKFGKLTVHSFQWYKKRAPCFLCQCDCGEWTITTEWSLRRGLSKSCGCLLFKRNTESFCNKHNTERIRIGITGHWTCKQCFKDWYENDKNIKIHTFRKNLNKIQENLQETKYRKEFGGI